MPLVICSCSSELFLSTFFPRSTQYGVLISFERGKDCESPAKTTTSSTTTRLRRDETTTTQDVSIMTPTASTVVVSSTVHAGSSHTSNAEGDP